MTARSRRIAFWSVPLLALAAALGWAFWPRPLAVDLARVETGPMVVTVAEQGVTRIKDVYTVSAPIRGRVLRPQVEEGDPVTAGETVIAELEPADPDFLDLRSEAEARAAIDVARAALAVAGAQMTQAEADLDFATAEVERTRELRQSGTVSARALQDAERLYRTAEAAVGTAKAAVEMRRAELQAAQVRLLRPRQTEELGTCPCIPIKAPVSGKVLRVLHESEGVVAAGEPLVEVGNPGELEVVADFLSSDAVRIQTGQRAMIEDWGGDQPLSGRVSRVEPYGFTKVSALGIEEQRVNVVIQFTGPPERWQRLGHGFEVDARVVLWEAENVGKVPLTALFREDGDWAVFRVADGRAVVQPVAIGHRTDLEAEVVEGLAAGDLVIRYPSDFVEPGAAVRQR